MKTISKTTSHTLQAQCMGYGRAQTSTNPGIMSSFTRERRRYVGAVGRGKGGGQGGKGWEGGRSAEEVGRGS